MVDTDDNIWAEAEVIMRRFNADGHVKGIGRADPFLIATAKLHNLTVVSGEKPAEKQARPKVPDVCNSLGVPCMTFLDVVMAERWVF